MSDLPAVGHRIAEDFQRPVLGRGGEGEVAGVGQHLAALHPAVDLVLGGFLLLLRAGLAQRRGHDGRGASALARMGFVDDDGETPVPVLVANGIHDDGELLDRGDDDLLALLNQLGETGRGFGVPHRGADLGELTDGVADLPVQVPAVGDDHDGIENWHAVFLKPDQLMGQPGDGVGLAAAGGVLDQAPDADALLSHMRQQLARHVQLMVTGPDLAPLLLLGLGVLLLDDLGVVLDDAGQAIPGEYLLPQVIGLETVGIGRVAAPVVMAQIKRKEPGLLALQVGAKPDLVVVHREVGQAPPHFEQPLPGVVGVLVLVDGVVHRLFF